ncbi:MAG: GntR family transcriptional regulator [Hamadaea sp.]|uniref:GntR family transcriptional regulator n=1 Tax=Hamadaea sp. TaxID=2024425 RepID=UPI00178F28D1|nr:GntR family transcriptional regulator [Hamadaea sp.]NUT20945.1 GntR family transcriptional regulator [Hamadaea sp.]
MARSPHNTFPEIPLPDAFDTVRAKGEQLREILEAMVREQPPGTLLPSERSIAERFQVARMTARQAITDLVTRGLIRRVNGAGTFVAEPRLTHGTTTGSFSHDMRLRGLVPGARVVSSGVRPATGLIAQRLQLTEGDPIVALHRVRTADGVPIAVENTHLPADRFPGLLDLLGDDRSLYAILNEHWGVQIATAAHRVSVIALDDTDAELLEVPPGLPSFVIDRVAYDAAGAPIEWGRSRYRGDRYDVEFDVHPS